MGKIDNIAKEVMLKMKSDNKKGTISAKELARFIDHTLLKPEATPNQITSFVTKQKNIVLLLYVLILLMLH